MIPYRITAKGRAAVELRKRAANKETHPMKRYIGDGVYVAFDGYGSIVLTTENGISVTNTIVLEHEVLVELERFVAELRAAEAKQKADQEKVD